MDLQQWNRMLPGSELATRNKTLIVGQLSHVSERTGANVYRLHWLNLEDGFRVVSEKSYLSGDFGAYMAVRLNMQPVLPGTVTVHVAGTLEGLESAVGHVVEAAKDEFARQAHHEARGMGRSFPGEAMPDRPEGGTVKMPPRGGWRLLRALAAAWAAFTLEWSR